VNIRSWLPPCLLAAAIVGSPAEAQRRPPHAGVAFARRSEPREGAFTILVPAGWTLRGGIFRVNAAQADGPLNALEAKCDLWFLSDARGTVAYRILPDIVYAHPGVGGGLFPPGRNYQGAMVKPFLRAEQFLSELFRTQHPQASDVRVLATRRLPGEIEAMQRGQAFTNDQLRRMGGEQMAFQYDAAGTVVEYTEGGVRYREVLVTGIVDMRAALTWKNTRTLAFRAPAAEWDRWRFVMDVMRSSLRFNPTWVLHESEGQRQRADFAANVMRELSRIDQEIAARRRNVNSEIMNDNYLVLTGQAEYVNPRTREVEVDTDQFRFRWTTPSGDRYFTNEEGENPNQFLQRSDYRLTPVRRH
jgi:hypothetical protein